MENINGLEFVSNSVRMTMGSVVVLVLIFLVGGVLASAKELIQLICV